jgi:hypothetical protein
MNGMAQTMKEKPHGIDESKKERKKERKKIFLRENGASKKRRNLIGNRING